MKKREKFLIRSATEHLAFLETCAQEEEREGNEANLSAIWCQLSFCVRRFVILCKFDVNSVFELLRMIGWRKLWESEGNWGLDEEELDFQGGDFYLN